MTTKESTRAVELVGDSPELIAFAMLRSIIQVQQVREKDAVLDKAWLLENYAECLAVVKGEKPAAKPTRRAKAGE